ncbi:MAG: inorganic diphosphatase [Candidatus Anstonellales archaeon]
MNLLKGISSGSGDVVNAVIEVPRGSRNKYEYDKEAGVVRLDRVLHSPFFYPTDYGFIPQTWYDDEDPLDIMVYTRDPTFPGCVVEARVIGMMRMEDEKGTDDKLIAVPTGDPLYADIQDITDLPSSLLEEIAHFFERYKDLEKGKSSKVKGWFDKKDALKVLEKGRRLFKKKYAGSD